MFNTPQLCIPHGLFGTRRGHHFEARFDTIIDWDAINASGIVGILPDIINKRFISDDELAVGAILGRSVYLRDICARCGATIERSTIVEEMANEG